nr:immunoglobulin heavy chain junction region [Macaca mulatta]MOV40236.1 immunoglobulin heavy chain junction region [Macaca mulatta]MOV43050.1 immunoglobulin heavy chain junction region [Macaca mulatta]MOV45640.1 immunoglobulin heavy chain junction region [Macaca mulatta]MOV46250.1 immunoglobulin heavy chain junction region [Macaca mulatta]
CARDSYGSGCDFW